jgi:probable rRNA maturation factor
MGIFLTVQNASNTRYVPSKKKFQVWVESALGPTKKQYEILLRIVGVKEITTLNKQYRKKNKPTNILSFNFWPPSNIKSNFLGDLIICAPVVKLEAKLQQKKIMAHWAHLTIHGVLHLLGYDHENEHEAIKMEKREIRILKKLNIANPYCN